METREATGARSGKRALLLLLDGCRPDAMLAAKTPHLKSLAFEGGAFSFHVDCGGIPLSAPCWTTILTGVSQGKHRVSSNDLDRLLQLNAEGRVDVLPDTTCTCFAARGPLCSIFSQAKSRSGSAHPLPDTVFQSLATSSRRSVLFTAGTWEGLGRLAAMPAGCREKEVEHSSLHVRHFASDQVHELQASEDAVSAAEALIMDEDGATCPDLLAIYTHAIDGAGHTHGFGFEVSQYRAAIEHVDLLVGRLVHAVGNRIQKQHEDWLIIVTTDHSGTSQARMPRKMRSEFRECGCLHKGIPQKDLPGVHGLREFLQHTQTFQILGKAGQLDAGEMLPSPEPEDIVPTLLHHLLGDSLRWDSSSEMSGKVRGFLPDVPPLDLCNEEDKRPL